jgi:hypothetical protein
MCRHFFDFCDEKLRSGSQRPDIDCSQKNIQLHSWKVAELQGHGSRRSGKYQNRITADGPHVSDVSKGKHLQVVSENCNWM